jgi:hypothetical protein
MIADLVTGEVKIAQYVKRAGINLNVLAVILLMLEKIVVFYAILSMRTTEIREM